MSVSPTTSKDKIVVALDVPNRDAALSLVEQLTGFVGMFKIGKQLFTAEGPQLVREIVASGERVFLDLKFHDIPNTVAGAAQSASRLGVSLFNVHALGGSEMLRAAVEALQNQPATPRVHFHSTQHLLQFDSSAINATFDGAFWDTQQIHNLLIREFFYIA